MFLSQMTKKKASFKRCSCNKHLELVTKLWKSWFYLMHSKIRTTSALALKVTLSLIPSSLVLFRFLGFSCKAFLKLSWSFLSEPKLILMLFHFIFIKGKEGISINLTKPVQDAVPENHCWNLHLWEKK